MCQAAFLSTYMVCTLRARSTACYTLPSFLHHLITTNLHYECTTHNLNHHASQACCWYPVSTRYWSVGIRIPKPIVKHAIIKWGRSADGYQDYSANRRKSSDETIAQPQLKELCQILKVIMYSLYSPCWHLLPMYASVMTTLLWIQNLVYR